MKSKLENELSKPHSGALTQGLSSLKGVRARPQEDLLLLGLDTTEQTQLPDPTQALPSHCPSDLF